VCRPERDGLEPGARQGIILGMAADDRQTPAPKDRKVPWQHVMRQVIFEADTPTGKAFDVVLLVAIVFSVIVVMLDSVAEIHQSYRVPLAVAEWTITVLFTIEYVARLLCVTRPWRYVRIFYGIVDLLAILPTYLSVFFVGAHSLLVIRTLRLVRIFRVFKLSRYLTEAQSLMAALRATRARITVFLVVVLTLILIIGAAMYLIEGGQPDTQFTSIPRSVYWAIVTMTTVGYGDIAPQTVIGQTVAAGVMILGYAIIIVPIGVFSTEILAAKQQAVSTRSCPSCVAEGHDLDAAYCKFCGSKL
jgi:voltage-gated potassium channel